MLPNGVTPFVISQNMRLPTVDAWNFTIQRQMTTTVSLEAAYVGNKGTHVFAGTGGDYDPNQATIVGFGTLSTNQRKPYFQKFGGPKTCAISPATQATTTTRLQMKVEKRFSHGLQLLGHYTWSRNMDYSGTYYQIDAHYAYGPADNNRAHALIVASLWEVPFGRGRKFGGNSHRNRSTADRRLADEWRLNCGERAAVHADLSGLQLGPRLWLVPAGCGGDWQASNPSQFGWFKRPAPSLRAPMVRSSGAWQRPQRASREMWAATRCGGRISASWICRSSRRSR